MKIKIVVLAAGNSTRFQENKLLYKINGKEMIRYVFDTLEEWKHEIVVVTQYDNIETMCIDYGYTCIKNNHPEKGLSHSLHLAIQHSTGFDAILFICGDQPYLSKYTIYNILKQVNDTYIICAAYQGERAHPVLFPKVYFKELLAQQGDIGGRNLLLKYTENIRYVNVSKEEVKDIDTANDLK